MATQSEKNRPHRADPVAPKSSPILPVALAISLAGNVALAVWLGRATSNSKSTEGDVSVSLLQSPAVGMKGSETTLPADLAPYAALGSYLADNNHIAALKWSDTQFRAFERGVRATYEGHGYPLDDNAAKLRDEVSAKVQAMLEPAAAANPVEDYFRTLREKENVQRTPTGLHYRITQEGFGTKPGPDSIVVTSYGARLPDGHAIPSLTRARVRSAVRDLLPGLGEGVQLLAPGGKALVYLSPALSFRDGEWPADVPKGAPIIFFLELHAVE